MYIYIGSFIHGVVIIRGFGVILIRGRDCMTVPDVSPRSWNGNPTCFSFTVKSKGALHGLLVLDMACFEKNPLVALGRG